MVERTSIWSIYCAILDLVQQRQDLVGVLEALDDGNMRKDSDNDSDLQLLPGLQDLYEVEGYMGGLANGQGLRKCSNRDL